MILFLYLDSYLFGMLTSNCYFDHFSLFSIGLNGPFVPLAALNSQGETWLSQELSFHEGFDWHIWENFFLNGDSYLLGKSKLRENKLILLVKPVYYDLNVQLFIGLVLLYKDFFVFVDHERNQVVIILE